MVFFNRSYFLIHSQSRMQDTVTRIFKKWKSRTIVLVDSECYTKYPDLYRLIEKPFVPVHHRLPLSYSHYIPNLGNDNHYQHFCNNKLSNNYYNWCRQEDYISDQIELYKTATQNDPIIVRLPYAFIYPDAVPLRLNKRGHKNLVTIQLLESRYFVQPDYFLDSSSSSG